MKNFLPKQYKQDRELNIKHNYLSEQFFDYKQIFKKIEKVVRNNDFTLGKNVNDFEDRIKKLLKANFLFYFCNIHTSYNNFIVNK